MSAAGRAASTRWSSRSGSTATSRASTSAASRHRRPRGGDALLAAGRRQADPPGAGAGHGRGARASSPGRCCRWRRRIELIHTYSLIHDDLPAMDDDDLRRGKPTCHVALRRGRGHPCRRRAVRRGAAARARSEQPGDPANVVAAVRELTVGRRVGGMVGGQYIDVTAPGDLDADGLRRLHELKTGRLIAASVECVLLLAGASGPATIAYRPVRRGARRLVPDRRRHPRRDRGRRRRSASRSGSDERHGKRTYVSVFGLDRARELAGESHAGPRGAAGGRRPDRDGSSGSPTTSSRDQT